MKKIIFLLFVGMACFAVNAHAQATMPEEISLPEYYRVKGYIFPAAIALPAPLDKLDRFTPTVDDIKRAEKIFAGEYHHLINDYTDPGKYYAKFVRQYIGYVAAN